MDRPGSFSALPDQSLHLQKAFLHKISGAMCSVEAEEDNLYVLHFFQSDPEQTFLAEVRSLSTELVIVLGSLHGPASTICLLIQSNGN